MYGGIQGGGGVSGDFFLDTSLLDLNTGRWERISDDSPPGARAGAIAIAVCSAKEDAVFLWGGLQACHQSKENLFAQDRISSYTRQMCGQ